MLFVLTDSCSSARRQARNKADRCAVPPPGDCAAFGANHAAASVRARELCGRGQTAGSWSRESAELHARKRSLEAP